MEQPPDQTSLGIAPLKDSILAILETLSPIEAAVLRRRFGVAQETSDTYAEAAHILGVSADEVRRIESTALRKLRHSSMSRGFSQDAPPPPQEATSALEVRSLLEQVRELTPELVSHLKRHSDDLMSVPPDVFEHLVAELLASNGLNEVRLVGKNSWTAADIFVASRAHHLGVPIRYFVEVKRWRDKIGVEVIDRVLGAMVQERPKHGWHAALVVSINGFRDFKKYTDRELALLGVNLKDKTDLDKWLIDYKPSASGLWVPAGQASAIPEM